MMVRFLLLFGIAFSLLRFELQASDQKRITSKNSNDVETLTLEKALLPSNHPLQKILPALFNDPEMFASPLALEQAGFLMKWNALIAHEGTILVAAHPAIPSYLIKKHRNHFPRESQLTHYLTRIQGARKISRYIKEHTLYHLVVPKKWLFRLPQIFDDPLTGSPDYLLVVEKMDICEGGWWGGETLMRYQNIHPHILTELSVLLQDLNGCDAWPQNQPFTKQGKIAFIDTEHLGTFYGDFLERIVPFIPPNLVDYALHLWNKRDAQRIAP